MEEALEVVAQSPKLWKVLVVISLDTVNMQLISCESAKINIRRKARQVFTPNNSFRVAQLALEGCEISIYHRGEKESSIEV